MVGFFVMQKIEPRPPSSFQMCDGFSEGISLF